MLTKKQISEIREHLEKAQNPIFFFDNDADGLSSFLLLRRFIDRGKGVPVKSFPSLDKSYFRRINEFDSDYVFILDKPEVSEDFLEEVRKINLPVVWIDHHVVKDLKVPDFVNYYNPVKENSKDIMATTYFCWEIIGKKKEYLWIAVVGCIGDHFYPEFYVDFLKQYPDLGVDSKDAFEILYKSEIGKIIRMFGDGLKDRISNTMAMLRFLIQSKNPYEVLEESNKNKLMHKRHDFIEGKRKKLVEKAKSLADDSKLLFFQYSGDMSISSDLANELNYLFPEKFVFVVYTTGVKANISARGKNVKEILINSIEGFEGATGGGHEDAVGAMIKIDDLEEFIKRVGEIILN